jgi:uncharacterized protein (DUF1684 family)
MKAVVMIAALAALGVLVPVDEGYRAEVLKWRSQREQRLKADGGWLTVAGLFWLKDGPNRFGTSAQADIVLPPGSAPASAGAFELRGGDTIVRLEPGVNATIDARPVSGPVPMRPDTSGSPDVLEMGRLSFLVIERGGRLAIRLKDKESPARKAFTGLTWFEVDPKYRVQARWVAYEPPKAVRVPNVLGQSETMPSPGRAEFAIDGKPLHLDGVLEEPAAKELFFIFRDQTSGKETYGAGRFLYAELPSGGTVRLDFNKAYNPPCAFTAFATCPLPPPQNWLPARIKAGERNYGHGH